MSKTSTPTQLPMRWWTIAISLSVIIVLLAISVFQISKHNSYDKELHGVLAQQLITIGLMHLNSSASEKKSDQAVSEESIAEIRLVCRKNTAYLAEVADLNKSKAGIIKAFTTMCREFESGIIGGYLSYETVKDRTYAMNSIVKDDIDSDERRRSMEMPKSEKSIALGF